MKKLGMIVSLFIVCTMLCSCPKAEINNLYITFINKSERAISCQEFWSKSITDADTLFQCDIHAVCIPVNSIHNFLSINYSGWNEDFKVIPYIQFLVMDDSTFLYYTELLNWELSKNCDTIRKYVPVLHCYRLTLEDLQRMNWTVVYPPEE